jgi:phenylpyruvate tautomerase PptA (4-oxalocrotonate tautomerase family)
MTDLMASVLGKKANLTSVLLEQPPVASWTIGRTPARVAVHVKSH